MLIKLKEKPLEIRIKPTVVSLKLMIREDYETPVDEATNDLGGGEEVVYVGTDEEIGVIENFDGVRIARDADWEIWVEPLNFVLRLGSKNSYFSDFTSLLNKLKQNRIKYWLTQEKWYRIEIALEKANQDMEYALAKMQRGLQILEAKFGIHDTSQ